MPDTVRRYIDATVAVTIMATLGIVSGFVAVGLTGDRKLAVVAAFAFTGVVLTVRLWRLTRRPVLPHGPAA